MKSWNCKLDETLNPADVFQCENCGNYSPRLVELTYREYLDSSEPIFIVSWKVDNSEFVSLDNGIGKVGSEGKCQIKVSKNTILNLSASNQFADRTFQMPLDLPKPVIEFFNVDSEIVELGKQSSFSWKVRNAEKVTLTEIGDVTELTNKEFLINSTKKIFLSAENSSGKVQKSITLTLPKPEILSFSTDKVAIVEGEDIVLRWHIKNAETVEVNKIGRVEDVGIGEIKMSPKSKSRCTIVAKNNSGETSKDLVIEVEPKPFIEYLKVSNDKVLKSTKINLSWSTINTSKVYLISGSEKIDVSGLTEYIFLVTESVSFRLVAYSINSISEVSKSVSITVLDSVKILKFSADKLFTIQSKPIELTWNVKNANFLKITPDVGIVTTKKKVVVIPEKKTTYTLEASNELTVLSQTVTIDVLPLPTISTLKLADVPKFNLTTPIINLYNNPFSSKESPSNLNFWKRLFPIRRPTIKKSKFGFLEFKSNAGLVGIDSQSPFYLFKDILNQQNLNFQSLYLKILNKINSNL